MGVILLSVAFVIGIKGIAWRELKFMALIIILGLLGIFLLFQGIGFLFEGMLKKKNNISGLKMFTFRQIQESVFLKPNTLAVSSLLVLMAISCFAYGIPVGYLFNTKEAHIMDYTFEGEEEEVKSVIKDLDL
ncbi:ABC transporter permease, partial [Clostridium saudiense]|nr:ABC transporter permease [Clostridium saudiense]